MTNVNAALNQFAEFERVLNNLEALGLPRQEAIKQIQESPLSLREFSHLALNRRLNDAPSP